MLVPPAAGCEVLSESSSVLKPRVTALLVWDLVSGRMNPGLNEQVSSSSSTFEDQRTGKSWTGNCNFAPT